MASQTGKWREEQILVICPGSQTTMAQLGCGELTPPAYRFPTRMFRDDESDDWRPYHTEKRKKASPSGGVNGTKTSEEDEWEYVEDPDSTEGAVYPLQAGRITNMEAFLAFLDHVHSMLTTTYHNTPIMLMASPQWTRSDCEAIARYVFEKTKTPSLCLIHSGVATQYGLKWPHMTVVDVGFEKVDVTCIYDSRVVAHKAVGPGLNEEGEHRAISGGELFTQKLLSLLKDKGFDKEMAEQLKRSHICEVLPYAPDSDQLMELPAETGSQGSTTAPGTAGDSLKAADLPRPFSGGNTGGGEAGYDGVNGESKGAEDDGVLDVANIVNSGQTREFLAKKEKEKAEKAKQGKRGKDKDGADAAAAKAVRLPNAKRERNVFHFEEIVTEDVPPAPASALAPAPAPAPAALPVAPSLTIATEPAPAPAPVVAASEGAAPSAEPGKESEVKEMDMADVPPAPSVPSGEAAPAIDGTTGGDMNSVPEANDGPPPPPTNGDAPIPPEPEQAPLPEPEPAPATAPAAPERQNKRVRRDIEVGLERFLFADRAEIDRIVTAIYRAVQGVEDMYMRPSCWDNLVFVGNGARTRGLKENIMQTLAARHLISPSTATMFTSELPSNLATPSGTGSQTPTGSFAGQLPTTSSVNPLLQAATTASLGIPGPSGGIAVGAPGSVAADGMGGPSHHFHSQTPTSIKLAILPTYLSEWTKNGFEEAMFLGAQVAARLAFCVHNLDMQGLESQRLMSLNRVDYNEFGPKAIRTHSMLG